MYFFFGNHFENKEPEAETRRGLRRAGGASLQWSLLRFLPRRGRGITRFTAFPLKQYVMLQLLYFVAI